ncbi:hypothetical protein ACS0TY_028049 [Phlomoides rotata]
MHGNRPDPDLAETLLQRNLIDTGVDFDSGKKIEKSYFDVLGVCCSTEIPLVEHVVNSLDGIKEFSILIPTRTLIVFHDPLLISRNQIVEALNRARLEAAIRVDGTSNYKNKWPSPYSVASGTLLALSFFKYVYTPLSWLAVAATVVGSPPIILKAFAALRNLYLDVNILVLIAVGGSIGLGDYWEAGTIVFLFTISTWLESRASHSAAAAMSSLVSIVPQKAVLAETGEEINAEEVKLNTVLAVKAGEVIPIDGVVVQGKCEVDEKILTGESFPVTKQKDSSVWASTINLNGYISIRTTAIVEDCAVARMAKIVEEAQKEKSSAQRLLDKCARYYTPAIVAISACLALVPITFHTNNKKQWYHLALVVLVNGCPCALLLSTPVAMFCALSKAATLGVLFKGAQHLETLARVKAIAFDKTGTITRGEFLMEDFKQLQDEVSLNTLLFWISSIECKSSHPMADALVDFARGHGVEPKPDRVENYQNFPGEGISGKIDDNELYIGNWRIASRAGCTTVQKVEGYNDMEGKSIGYVFLGSSPAAVFSLSDVCRTGAKDAIQELNSMGIKTVMLTGDCHAAAKHAQDQLGGALEVVHAELLPEDKTCVIKELQREGATAMIGDGLNDAPALATADIGISMGLSGSALATESGDVVLMSNDILRIPKMLRLAKSVRRKLIENVVFSISIKVAILGIAIAGYPLVWVAVLSDVGTCLLVIFNSMLLLKDETEQGEKCYQSENKFKLIESEKCGSNSGCCGENTKVNQDVESQVPRKKCCSGSSLEPCGENKKCPSSTKKGDQCCPKVNQDVESQVPRKKCCSGSSLEPRGENKKCSSSKKKHGDTDKGDQCCPKVDRKDSGTTLDHLASEETGRVVSVSGCKNITECSEVCTKQHGSCTSDSFRRECCIGDGDSGTDFKGGLSEIVIQ